MSKCHAKRILKGDNAGGAYLDRWFCASCKNTLLARWDGELHQPHELIHLTEFPNSPVTLSKTSDENYTVVREEAEEITDAQIAA